MGSKSTAAEVEQQRAYYASSAARYDGLHLDCDEEHSLALAFLQGVVDYHGLTSMLDVGAGTGRAVAYMQQRRPELRIVGVEPVAELREQGYRKGLSPEVLLDGDGTSLAFSDQSFDVVTAFGVLHHVRYPQDVLGEMLRTAKRAVFISDCNNFGQGNPAVRFTKQMIHGLGLWPLANFIKTGGRGYSITEEDGLAYSFSLFDYYRFIRRRCAQVHVLVTKGEAINAFRQASHVALLGIK